MLVVRNAALHDKIFAVKGELINNRGHVVEVYKGLFNIPIRSILLPMADIILAALAADATIVWMGPYSMGDSDTSTVKVRKICLISYSLGGLFIHHKEVKWQLYFSLVHPLSWPRGRRWSMPR